jgi:hypothetical protein
MSVIIDGTNGITSPSFIGQAGTATVAPLDFTAGTNLTTPLAGAFEYDGKVFYATPQGTQRGVMPASQFFRLNTALAGADAGSGTAQSVFGVGVTLSSSTVYAFEAYYLLTKTAGTTSHTVGYGFGGTATLNNILHGGPTNWSTNAFANGLLSGANSFDSNSASNVVGTAALASAATTARIYLRGTVSVNAGGTFIPQYTLSAAPGGAYTTAIGSYFLIYPISASGANVNVGTWA